MTPTSTTNGRPRSTSGLDKEIVRKAIGSRAVDLLVSVGIPADVLDCRHHPCPQCGGKDRFRLIDAAAGAVLCSKCFSQKNGDFFAAISWWCGCEFQEAVEMAADFAGMTAKCSAKANAFDGKDSSSEEGEPSITFKSVCESKGMPFESAKAYGAKPMRWGDKRVVEFPVYGPDGKQCSRFAIPAEGGKGRNQKGAPAGLFLPHRDSQPILPQPGEEWLVVEGVKDPAALHGLGFNAVGLPTSSMNWKFAPLFAGVKVIIVPDLDKAGQSGAINTATALAGMAASVRIARLPGEVKNSDGDDVRDVMAQEGGEAVVREAISNAVDADSVQPPGKQEPGASTKREIDVSVKDLSDITPQAWAALQECNDPPTLFRYAGVPSRIEDGDESEPIIKPLDFHRLRYHLARAAWWQETRKTGDETVTKTIPPPQEVVNDVLATPNHPLPVLSRIVEAPVFAPDGTLQIFPGYHPRSQTYFFSAQGLAVPDVPDQPNRADLEAARALIVDELLGDFPFVSDAELAHAVAIIVLPFARDLIPGPTPLMLIEKPSPGTGATLLVDMLSLPATGRPIPTMTEGRDEDEWRKRITAKLRGGSALILIDNLRRRLDSAAVSAGITSTVWEDRILGASEMVRLPVRCVWLATGNNPAVSTEISRRTVRVRMDAQLDRPWLRSDFRHKNLRQWASEHRGELVWAALTMIRAWIATGRPGGDKSLGMFERWSEVIGGILSVAGVPGFLSNLEEFYEESDAEGASLRIFLAAWWDKYGEKEITVKDLWTIVSEEAFLPLGDGTEQSQRVKLGKMLADRRDRVFELEIGESQLRLSLQRGAQRQRAYRWKLQATKEK